MTNTDNKLNFDNEIKALAQCVYKENEKSIPKNWIKVSDDEQKSGFHGEAFFKNGDEFFYFK